MKCGEKFADAGWRCPSCRAEPKTKEGFVSFEPESTEAGNSFDPVFFSELASVEADNFWFSSRNELIIWSLGRYFPKAKSLLEVGCGTGFVLSGIKRAFPLLSVNGCDIHISGLTYAKNRLGDAKLFRIDARNIPFQDEFDVVASFDLLEHIREDERVIGEMYQAVRQGGGMILSVPQHPFLWRWGQFDRSISHVRRYTRKELVAKVEKAGFKVVDVISFVSLLFPLLVISRFKVRKRAGKHDPLEGLRIGNLTNAFLKKLMDLEGILVRLGMRLPFGGSLVLIAYKR